MPKDPKAVAQFLSDSPGLDKVFMYLFLLCKFHHIKLYVPVIQLNMN